MRAALLAFLIVLPAHADSEARQGADFVRITANPCSDAAVMSVIRQNGEDPADYRAARAEMNGQSFNGCWRPDFSRQVVILLYEDGDAGMVPFSHLKPLKQA